VDFEAAGDEDGGVVLVGHAVGAVGVAGGLDGLEAADEVVHGNVAGDEDGAGAALGPPDEVAVVAADGFREAEGEAVEVDGAGFAVVAGEDAGFGLLLRGEGRVGLFNGGCQLGPAVAIGKVLREGRGGQVLRLDVACVRAESIKSDEGFEGKDGDGEGDEEQAGDGEGADVGGLEPFERGAVADEEVEGVGAGGEEDGVGGGEPVELSFLEHEEYILGRGRPSRMPGRVCQGR
jgi:hypothetical protein